MSPPLAEIESETPGKQKKTLTHKQLMANQANARLSRGPGDAAKQRTRFDARKHDLRAESELEQAESNAEYLLELDHKAALVDVTPEGARRLGYKLGHGRSFDAACRRLEALQKDYPAGGKSTGKRPAAQVVNEPGPVIDTTVAPVETNAPVLSETACGAAPVTISDTLGVAAGGVVTITNDPIRDGFPATVTKPDTLGVANDEVVTITNDPIRDPIFPMVAATPSHDEPLTAPDGLAHPEAAGPLVSDGDSGVATQRTGEPPPDRPPP